MKNGQLSILKWLELSVMVLAVIFDVLLPSVVICAIGFISAAIQKERTPFLGTQFWEKPCQRLLTLFSIAVGLSILNYALIIPLVNHLTGSTQNMGIFNDLKGNTGLLIILLAYSWIMAAFIEEVAYRGFFQYKILTLFSNQRVGTLIAILLTSTLFGWMHSEQGVVGMINTTIDAILFSLIRYRYKSVWASIMVHGFSNTIGIVTFYFTGPIYGLW